MLISYLQSTETSFYFITGFSIIIIIYCYNVQEMPLLMPPTLPEASSDL